MSKRNSETGGLLADKDFAVASGTVKVYEWGRGNQVRVRHSKHWHGEMTLDGVKWRELVGYGDSIR